MALVHELLYHSGDLARVDLADYAKTLGLQLLHAYSSGPSPPRLKFDLEEIAVDIERAVPCGLILNELVSNAIKHAFPDHRPGEVRIRLIANPHDGFTLSVEDS